MSLLILHWVNEKFPGNGKIESVIQQVSLIYKIRQVVNWRANKDNKQQDLATRD